LTSACPKPEVDPVMNQTRASWAAMVSSVFDYWRCGGEPVAGDRDSLARGVTHKGVDLVRLLATRAPRAGGGTMIRAIDP
jgi:hypothetical protein